MHHSKILFHSLQLFSAFHSSDRWEERWIEYLSNRRWWPPTSKPNVTPTSRHQWFIMRRTKCHKIVIVDVGKSWEQQSLQNTESIIRRANPQGNRTMARRLKSGWGSGRRARNWEGEGRRTRSQGEAMLRVRSARSPWMFTPLRSENQEPKEKARKWAYYDALSPDPRPFGWPRFFRDVGPGKHKSYAPTRDIQIFSNGSLGIWLRVDPMESFRFSFPQNQMIFLCLRSFGI